MLRFIALSLVLLVPLASAHAGMSNWEEVEGGAIRVVTEPDRQADGSLRAVLEIKLNSGWKTYWRDPGDSGVPPSVTFFLDEAQHETSLEFPAPEWFDDGYSLWAGYDHDVSLPMTVTLPSGTENTALRAQVFLGICENICIPVQADLEIHPEHEDGGIVAAAFNALPDAESPAFSATVVETSAEGMVVEARVPHEAEAISLFVAGTAESPLKAPKLERHEAGLVRYRVAFLSPEPPGAEESFDYTLRSASGAVSGRLELPR